MCSKKGVCRIYISEAHFDDMVNGKLAFCTVHLNSQTKDDLKDVGEAFQR